MSLHTPTIFIVMVFVTLLIGGLLLLSWRHNRQETALLWWGAGYCIGSPGMLLLALRGHIPNVLSIDIANALILLTTSLAWAGARAFDGKRQYPLAIVAGAIVWIAACQIPAFYASMPLRIVLATTLLSAYTLLLGLQLLSGRGDGLKSRWPTAILVLAHVGILMLRLPLNLFTSESVDNILLMNSWYAAVNFEALLYVIALAFMALSMTRERSELRYKMASLRDPLTGIANRRAFFEDADKLLSRMRRTHEPVAVIVFDLDRFKDINDTYGHHIGDQVIQLFASIARGELRREDVFGRIGGEEFAALVTGGNIRVARDCAERIRQAFADAADHIGGHPVAAQVSAGVAMTAEHPASLRDLMAAADRALYRSKEAGRNRVEIIETPPSLMMVNSAA